MAVRDSGDDVEMVCHIRYHQRRVQFKHVIDSWSNVHETLIINATVTTLKKDNVFQFVE